MEDKFIHKRNVTLDLYKGILIILVVIRHVLQYSVTDEGGILTNLIWAVQMPGFMMISGFFCSKHIEKKSEVKKSIKKSVERYLMPFLSWWILISVLLLGKCGRDPIKGVIALAQNVSIGLWFLWVIFVLSIVFSFCNLVVSRGGNAATKTLWLMVVFFLSCGVFYFFYKFSILGVKLILYYLVFYGFGWVVNATGNYWKPIITSKIKHIILLFCFVIFIAICYNFDLYCYESNLFSTILRLLAGFSGNAVLLSVVDRFRIILMKCKVNCVGKYTLEIYATHMYVNNLFIESNTNSFFTLYGFTNFSVSLICTVVFTTVIIAVIKSIPAANYILYGKK